MVQDQVAFAPAQGHAQPAPGTPAGPPPASPVLPPGPPTGPPQDRTIVVQDLTHASLKEAITTLTLRACWDVKTVVQHISAGNCQGPRSWQELVGWPPERVLQSVVATFFVDEPDSNRGDRPRCDFVLTLADGTWVRYHPQAEPIWSTEHLPSYAMQVRYNRAKRLLKLARKQQQA